MIPRKTQQFIDFLDGLRGRREALVLAHDHPDPDSLSAAWCLKKIFEEVVGLKTTIAYGGIVGRAENRALMRRLKLPAVHVSDLRLDRFDTIAMVDTQPFAGNNSLPAHERLPDIVIDHHPRKPTTPDLPWLDIRPQYGATVTIALEYLRALELQLDKRMATAIYYALRSETQDLGREASPHDRRAYLQMVPLFDPGLLFDIVHAKVSRDYFRMLHEAFDHALIYDDVLITNLFEVPNPDHVAEVADMLLRAEGIRWTLVLGRYAGSMHLSIRTERRDVDAGEIMKILVGGMGTGGGHDMIAGGKIPDVPADITALRTMEDALTKIFLHAIHARLEVGTGLVTGEVVEPTATDLIPTPPTPTASPSTAKTAAHEPTASSPEPAGPKPGRADGPPTPSVD